MKKILSFAMAAIMLFACLALASCSNNKYQFGVQSGTTGWCFLSGDEDWGFQGYPNVDVNGYNNGALAVTDLINGKIDYVVIDDAVAKELVSKHADDIKLIDIPLTVESYGIAVDKGQAELLTQINTVLEEKKTEIEAIFAKFENINVDDDGKLEDGSAYAGVTVPAGKKDSSKNQLVVATNAAFAPFEFKVGTNFGGIDIEIAKLIADTLGMELVIVDMEFDSIMGALGKDGVDVGIAAMTINAARKKVANLSNAYYNDAYQVVIARKDDTRFDACTKTDDILAILAGLGEKE